MTAVEVAIIAPNFRYLAIGRLKINLTIEAPVIQPATGPLVPSFTAVPVSS